MQERTWRARPPFPAAEPNASGRGVDRWIGPADRHNDGLFDQLRDHLVDGGVAVLTYDKRGAGHPDGVVALGDD